MTDLEDLDYLEVQYSPSKWSKRFSNSDEVIENHLKVTSEETELNKKKYNCKMNISYGESDYEKFDIYYKDHDIEKPIFVYVHGGYWQAIHKDICGYCVSPLVEQGYRVIILDYDLCPKITLSEMVNHIDKAIVKIFCYATETKAKHISFMGHSAGAHLIPASLHNMFKNGKLKTIETNLLNGIFLISGIYDLTDIWKTNSVNTNNILSLDATSAKELSPNFMDFNFLKTSFKNLKIFVIVAQFDSSVFHKQSENFHKLLLKSEIYSELKVFLNYDHFDIVEILGLNQSVITKYVLENLNKF